MRSMVCRSGRKVDERTGNATTKTTNDNDEGRARRGNWRRLRPASKGGSVYPVQAAGDPPGFSERLYRSGSEGKDSTIPAKRGSRREGKGSKSSPHLRRRAPLNHALRGAGGGTFWGGLAGWRALAATVLLSRFLRACVINGGSR